MNKPRQFLTQSEYYFLTRWIEANAALLQHKTYEEATALASKGVDFPITLSHVRSVYEVLAKAGVVIETWRKQNSPSRVGGVTLLALALRDLYALLGVPVPAPVQILAERKASAEAAAAYYGTPYTPGDDQAGDDQAGG